MRRSAHAEAVGHFRHGLEVVQRLPTTPERLWQTLLLYTEMGPALMLAKGQADAEVAQVYTQALPLCEQVGDPHQLTLVLTGLWRYYHARGVFEEAQRLGERLLTLAHRHQDNAFLVLAHWMLGATLSLRGDLLKARAYLEEGIVLATRAATITSYDPQQHQSLVLSYGTHPTLACYAHESWALWILGYPARAMQRNQEVLTTVQPLTHQPMRGICHNMGATLYVWCREGQIVQALAETAIALSAEHGLAYHLAWGTALRGVALLMQHHEDGLEQLQQGLSAYQGTQVRLFTPYLLALLAETYGKRGKVEAGLRTLAEAFLIVDAFGSYFLEAELYRLKGELLLRQSSDNAAAVETCFHHALDIARSQQAKSLELRAAMSLSRLWQQQGKRQEAHDLLASVYNWFTEGFDTADLKDAKVLLDELA
jgi:predicted ATPase